MAKKMDIKPYQVILTVFFLLLIGFFYWMSSLHFTQEFVGAWLGGLDPQRRMHLEQTLKHKSSRQLLRLLENGDFNKAAVAEDILMRRAPQELFNPIADRLRNNSERVRMAARRILPYIDREKAGKCLLGDLERFAEDSDDYRDILSILAYHRQKEVYPLLVKFANKPDAWNSAVASYFRDLGNPDAIPILEKLYQTIPTTNNFSTRMERKRIEKAIGILRQSINNSHATADDGLSRKDVP